jgi:integrase
MRISEKGRKTWIAMYRVRGTAVMETIGTTALIPKVADARELARQSMLKAKAGVNPVAERRARQEEEAANSETAANNRLDALFKQYVRRQLAPHTRPRTARAIEQYFAKDVLPKLSKRDIADITSKDIERILDNVVERGSPVAANRLLSRLRTFFRWCIQKEHLAKDPTAKFGRQLIKEVARDRVLSEVEIKLFWNGCENIGWPYGPLAKLLLLTAQRRNEVAHAEWTEFDLDKKIWVIPKERSKNGESHAVHLSPLVCEILSALPRIGDRFLFTQHGEKPVAAWTDVKARFTKHMGDIPHWTLHDLRRTAASHMAQLRVDALVVDKILNHSSVKLRGTAAIYNRYEYADERRAALNTWSNYIESLVNPQPSNVVPLATAAQV